MGRAHRWCNWRSTPARCGASSFVPMMSGWFPPRFRGELALDGGYSDNIPDLGGRTITVSPFSGDASICPAEHASSQLWSVPHGSGGSVHLSKENLFKLGNAMVPPDTRKMQTICAQGFSDAMSYLQSSEEIKCGQCETEICDMCTLKRSEASDQVLPPEITEVFDEIMELEANRKSSGHLFLAPYRVVAWPKMLCFWLQIPYQRRVQLS